MYLAIGLKTMIGDMLDMRTVERIILIKLKNRRKKPKQKSNSGMNISRSKIVNTLPNPKTQ